MRRLLIACALLLWGGIGAAQDFIRYYPSGVGSAATGDTFTVSGASYPRFIATSSTSEGGTLELIDSTEQWEMYVLSGDLYIKDIGGADRLKIQGNNGYIGMGRDPLYRLHVNGYMGASSGVITPYISAQAASNTVVLDMGSMGSQYGMFGPTAATGAGAWALGYGASAGTMDVAALTWTGSGYVQASMPAFSLTADAVVQFGQTVMPDAGTDSRFDVTTGSATLTIGVLGGVGASAQGTAYPVVYAGVHPVAMAEDTAVTRGHYLLQSATAGYCSDSATVSTDGLNIAKAIRSEPVTNVIVFNGCTGGTGCINTALNVPNVGPAGQITLSADVAAAGWIVGDPVVYWNSGGTSPTGLTDGATYWLKSVATTNVTIAATKTGAVIVPSDQGNDSTQYLQRLPLAVISIQ